MTPLTTIWILVMPPLRVSGALLCRAMKASHFMGAQQFFRLMGGKDAPGLEVFGEGEPRFQAGGRPEAGTARYAMRTFLMSMLMP